jgi:predicted porin
VEKTLKSIEPNHRPRFKKLASPLALAIAAALPLATVPVHADELSELKAQIQTLSKRLSDLEAKDQAAKAAAPAAAAAAPAPAPKPVPLALTTDQNGLPLDPSVNSITLYTNSNTSLRLYGIIEPTLSRTNHQTASGGTATGFQVSWFSGNRLGFDAMHALKLGEQFGMPDLKVIAKLESEFELPTGNMDTGNVFFNRDAWAGFYSEDLGKITFGRQNTLTRDFTQNWGDAYGTPEVTLKEGGYSNVNNFKQFIFYSAAATGTRVNSGIEWKKKWGAHWLTGLGYAFGSGGGGGSGDVGNGGSVPGDFTKGTNQAVSVAYNSLAVGGALLNLNASYDHANVADLAHKSELFGGNVLYGPFRLNAGVVHYTAQQGAGGSAGDRSDNSWTISGSYRPNKTEFALGYVRMKGSHAGFNAGGNTLNPMGNTSGVTTVADGAKGTTFGSIMYHADSQTDFYVAADHFNVSGGWVLGDAQGNGNHYGVGHTYQGDLELATGVRFKF